MSRRKGTLKKGVKRSTILTVTAIFALAIFLPAVMGGMSAWNDWIADHNGRAFMVRSSADLITADPVAPTNSTLQGDVVYQYYNATDVATYKGIDMIYGNTTNLGYHSFILEGNNSGSSKGNALVCFRLNATSTQLRDNNTVAFFMDVAGFSGSNITFELALHDSEKQFALANLEPFSACYDYVVADDNETLTFTTIEFEFSMLELLTVEDTVGVDNNVVIVMTTDGTDVFADGDECYVRLYDRSLNNFGTINTASGYTFTLFLIGVFLLSSAFVATPFVNVIGPGFTNTVKRSIKNRPKFRRR